MRLIRAIKSFIEWVIDMLRLWRMGVSPITADVVDQLIYSVFKGRDVSVVPADVVYYAPRSFGKLKEIVDEFVKKRYKYVRERFDCDDFAKQLHCFAVSNHNVTSIFIVYDYGMGHAYNLAILSDLSVYIVEPQNGAIMTPGYAEMAGYLRCPCTVVT